MNVETQLPCVNWCCDSFLIRIFTRELLGRFSIADKTEQNGYEEQIH